MPHVAKLPSLLALALIASCMTFATSTSAAKPAAGAKPHRFNVGGSVFAGSAKTICVIEGKWRDGGFFRFEAWDECSQMRMRRMPAASYRDVSAHGSNRGYTVADIPRGAEVLEVSNSYSSVLLFRDKGGEMREILSRD